MPSLDFSPLTSCSPLLPLCLWRGHALNHFTLLESAEIIRRDVSDLALFEALKQIYPQLTFAELARLHACLLKNDLSQNTEEIVAAYGYGFDQRLLQSFELFLKLPLPIQNWLEKHNISPRELLPLAALQENLWPLDLFSHLATADVSKNYGAQILQLLVENILLENSLEALQPPELPLTAANLPNWILELKNLRFPQTQKLDATKEKSLTSLPWTKDFETRWQRKGDQSGLEIRFTITSKNDLQNKLHSLEKVLKHGVD